MATGIYTQWHVFETLKLRHAAGAVTAPFPTLLEPSTSIDVIIPQHYHNTWSVSVGANYTASDTVTLRGGLGWDQSPAVRKYRNVQLPDNDRIGLGLGAHWQATKTAGIDVGWTHILSGHAELNPPAQTNGAVTVTTNGKVHGGGDVFAAQVVWDIV
jgi:long-chain fatty acid transport protein